MEARVKGAWKIGHLLVTDTRPVMVDFLLDSQTGSEAATVLRARPSLLFIVRLKNISGLSASFDASQSREGPQAATADVKGTSQMPEL